MRRADLSSIVGHTIAPLRPTDHSGSTACPLYVSYRSTPTSSPRHLTRSVTAGMRNDARSRRDRPVDLEPHSEDGEVSIGLAYGFVIVAVHVVRHIPGPGGKILPRPKASRRRAVSVCDISGMRFLHMAFHMSELTIVSKNGFTNAMMQHVSMLPYMAAIGITATVAKACCGSPRAAMVRSRRRGSPDGPEGQPKQLGSPGTSRPPVPDQQAADTTPKESPRCLVGLRPSLPPFTRITNSGEKREPARRPGSDTDKAQLHNGRVGSADVFGAESWEPGRDP